MVYITRLQRYRDSICGKTSVPVLWKLSPILKWKKLLSLMLVVARIILKWSSLNTHEQRRYLISVFIGTPCRNIKIAYCYLYYKTRHSYICCVLPAKRLNRLGWFFCGDSWVAGGCYRLKKYEIFFLFFFLFLFFFFSFFPWATPGPLATKLYNIHSRTPNLHIHNPIQRRACKNADSATFSLELESGYTALRNMMCLA